VATPILLHANNPGPLTGPGNNTYLLIGSDRQAVLIDAGVGDPRHLSAIDAELQRHEARLARVLVTHGHADHSSGAGALKAAHPGVRLQKLPWPGMDGPAAIIWEPIADGDRVPLGDEQLTVVHTPGHSPDHLVFWDAASRIAFTGDLVIKGSSVLIHVSRGGHLGQYMASLERVLGLGAIRLMPAHGERVDDAAAVLEGYLAHRRMRERQVAEALAAGHRTVETIADSIYHGLNPALMPAARENVQAHLEKLKDDGRAVEDNGIWTTSSISSTSTATDTSTS
jgi:glyoxylase-like metal-dependent hydrolase (beta-lactamase superfamily II)